MTETETKPATDLKARVAKVKSALKATYQHYRHEFAHHHILSNLPAEYRTMLGHAADTINSTCKNAGVQLIPEDLVIIAASAMLFPLSYFTFRKTCVFHIALHTYFVFIYPVMISLYDAESGDNAGAGADLVGWVLLSFWTILERIVPNGERGYERIWYLALKCAFAYGLFNPKFNGAAVLMKLVVRPKIMPALGLDGGTGATKMKKKKVAPSSSSAATAKSKDATEESDASTQNSKESTSSFSFVEKSELEQEQQPKTVHLKIESIEGTEWTFPVGKKAFEGPYLVLDVIDKTLDDVADFLPPSHAEAVSGKKVRTPVGALVEDEEVEEEQVTKKVEEEAAKEAAAADEPELAEEEAGKKADEAEGNNDEQAEGNSDASKEGSEDADGAADEKEQKAEEPTEEKNEEEADAKDEKGDEKEKPVAEEPGEKKGDEREEALPADAVKKEIQKPEKTSASFTWGATSLSVPVVLPPSAKSGEGSATPQQRLLRVVAYDKRTIGSDAFFGVAYAAAPISGEGSEGSKAEALVLKDGRTKGEEGGTAAEMGGVSLSLSCS